jgi:threonine dehydrogenase-like Zn-dependent dehydrogenase
MRAVRSTTEGIRVVDLPVPDGPGVRVSVTSSGICGSDLHLASFGALGVTLGHEFCGRLDDGTPVAVLPAVACGHCARCLAGDDQQCPEVLGKMYGVSLDGGLADEVWVDPSCAKVIPSAATFDYANLVEPVAVAVHGINRAGVAPGMRVLVIGAGPIGLCTIAVAGSRGIEVDLLAHRTSRIGAGERLGAGISAGTGYDVVLDAAGTQGSMDSAIERVRPGGTIGLLGTYWDPVTLGLAVQMKEVTLVPAFAYGHHHGVSEFEDAITVLGAVPALADTVITHRFGLDEAPEAFRVAGDRASDAIKVVLHP